MKPESKLVFSLDDVFKTLRDLDRKAQENQQAQWNYVDKPTTPVNNTIMKTCKFQTGVILAIATLRAAKAPFSIHDVTKELRRAVAAGELSFSDRTTEDVDGLDTYRVSHQDVREIFDDLFSNAILQNLSKRFNGRYFEYSDMNNMVPPTAPKTSLNISGIYCSPPPPVLAQPFVPLPSPALKVVSHQDPLVDKLKDYLRNKRGESVTMKQIQSRFDNQRGKTCKEYAQLVASLNLSVSQRGPWPSKWLVEVPVLAFS